MDARQHILVDRPGQDPREVRIEHPKEKTFVDLCQEMGQYGLLAGGWIESEGVAETITRISFQDTRGA